MIKKVTAPFEVHGTLKVKVEYCFGCEKWHAINETCSPYKENEIETEEDEDDIQELRLV